MLKPAGKQVLSERNNHRVQDFVCFGVHKVGGQKILRKLVHRKAVRGSSPLELAAVGAILEGMQPHPAHSVSEVMHLVLTFAEMLHDVVVPM